MCKSVQLKTHTYLQNADEISIIYPMEYLGSATVRMKNEIYPISLTGSTLVSKLGVINLKNNDFVEI